jgi:hypothetical protein
MIKVPWNNYDINSENKQLAECNRDEEMIAIAFTINVNYKLTMKNE